MFKIDFSKVKSIFIAYIYSCSKNCIYYSVTPGKLYYSNISGVVNAKNA